MIDRRTLLSLPLVVAAAGAATAPVAAAATPTATATATATTLPQQSPVDVRPGQVVRRRGLPPLDVHYERSAAVSVRYVRKDDGSADGCALRGVEETEEVDVEPGAGWIDYAGDRYDLQQFHFHTPSEHTVLGRHAPLEMHLVHASAAGRRLVVGVLLVAGPQGEADRVLQQLPGECDAPVEVDDLDLRALLPRRLATVRYSGSLTTAPFTEGVQWFLTAPETVSREGISAFQTLFPDGDSRDTQPLNGRVLVADPGW